MKDTLHKQGYCIAKGLLDKSLICSALEDIHHLFLHQLKTLSLEYKQDEKAILDNMKTLFRHDMTGTFLHQGVQDDSYQFITR